MTSYNVAIITGGGATQRCDPSAVAVPYGGGLVSSWMPTPYDDAGGFKATNSSPTRGRYSLNINQLFRMRTLFD